MMADQVGKCNIKHILLMENAFSIKEEGYVEGDLGDDKVDVSETAIMIDNVELHDHTTQCNVNKVEQYEVPTVLDNIKTELSSSELQYNTLIDSVKMEEGIIADIKIESYNGLLYCEHCQAYYEDYCIKCRMLVHILNRNADCKTEEELPKAILEIQHKFGQFGIFVLKVIPESVIFGPFTGLSRTECPWIINGGKIVVPKDKSKYLNWMQYINHAANISEHNLLVFQHRDNLYYQSTRQIQKGDELLVYFGEEYEDRLNKSVEVDFIPTPEDTIEDVFACTFCCLGFSSRTYLAKHKTVCLGDAAEQFSIEELTQCQICNIYLQQKEYYEHHMTYCCERNDRKCIATQGNQTTEVIERTTSTRRQMYKCERCKYTTKYNAVFKHHSNRHCEVKPCKCGISNRRPKTGESLRLHLENTHFYVGGMVDPEHSSSGYMNAHIKAEGSNSEDEVKQLKCLRCEFRSKQRPALVRHVKTKHLKEFNYKCEQCDYQTNLKTNLERHVKTKHLKEFYYRCEQCDYQTNLRTNLEIHVKTKHLKEFNYKCGQCDYKTNNKADLEKHVKTKHLKQFNYMCEQCDFKTNHKANLEIHVKTKHLKEFNYRCEQCDFKTNNKSALEIHVKAKHLNEFNYKCEQCNYKTNNKADLEKHVKSKHLKQFNYMCEQCDYQTNLKTNLEIHVKTKHLKEFNYRCEQCHFKTNHKANLERHVKTRHLKELNYKCEQCDYKINHKQALEKHINTKHLKESSL